MAGLSTYPMMAVLRAEDLERAEHYYTEALGLERGIDTGPGSAVFSAGNGSMVMLYERPGMPAPENTTLSFAVPAANFDGVITELRVAGVVFEDYNMPEMDITTTNGVAEWNGTKMAWFKDSEGNILNVVSM